ATTRSPPASRRTAAALTGSSLADRRAVRAVSTGWASARARTWHRVVLKDRFEGARTWHEAAPEDRLVPSGWWAQALPRIRFSLVPQTGQTPLAILRPFATTTSPSASRFSLHFTQ